MTEEALLELLKHKFSSPIKVVDEDPYIQFSSINIRFNKNSTDVEFTGVDGELIVNTNVSSNLWVNDSLIIKLTGLIPLVFK